MFKVKILYAPTRVMDIDAKSRRGFNLQVKVHGGYFEPAWKAMRNSRVTNPAGQRLVWLLKLTHDRKMCQLYLRNLLIHFFRKSLSERPIETRVEIKLVEKTQVLIFSFSTLLSWVRRFFSWDKHKLRH